ncbi:hypothetical protein BSKO_05473 [Bryopsis sp. KO-2023]|nr:hypothetical protein BSKO_05473 [Bryopsis sp. KO-2023]
MNIMNQTATRADRFRGCLVGLATGDAVGTTLEFRNRGHFKPIDDMVGGGPFSLKPGQWTDDTSMALCLAASLVEKQGMDLADQLTKYNRWYHDGYMSSNGSCFDIGMQTRRSLGRFATAGEVYDVGSGSMSEGNGSLMRLAPVPMFYSRNKSKAIEMAAESSRTTHGAKNCLDCCSVFAEILVKALEGAPKEEILKPLSDIPADYSDEVKLIMQMKFLKFSERRIRGSGHVIRCLEAALWCFHHTDNFRDAILKAANLGEDADTTAAVCGQIAGAFYGETGIPASWLEKLAFRPMIEELADKIGDVSDAAT